MSVSMNRVTHGVDFNTGISVAEYNEAPVGQTQGQTQGAVLPGSTTVSEALANVFPHETDVTASLLGMLAAEGSSLALRTPGGFRAAAKRTIRTLRGMSGSSEAASAAAAELEALLDDTELLDRYRASLLET